MWCVDWFRNCLQANQRVTVLSRANNSSRGLTRREAACFSSGSTATASSPALAFFSTKVRPVYCFVLSMYIFLVHLRTYDYISVYYAVSPRKPHYALHPSVRMSVCLSVRPSVRLSRACVVYLSVSAHHCADVLGKRHELGGPHIVSLFCDTQLLVLFQTFVKLLAYYVWELSCSSGKGNK